MPKHHPALPHAQIADFMADLEQRSGVAARALAFTILTAARSGETRGMTWAEVDLEAGTWTIPVQRMKANKEHRVPLTDAAIALLGNKRDAGNLVFESEAKQGKPISNMSMTAVLRRMERSDITVHGFRSTFRDWAGETTGFPREVIEAALAHGIKDKSEAAYCPDDPLFPATALKASMASGFQAAGFECRPWKTTEPVRKIVNEAFARADLPAYGPHAFRHMLARLVAKTSTSIAELVATSQNLGHTDVLTTLRSYGQISRERQRALITGESLPDDVLEN